MQFQFHKKWITQLFIFVKYQILYIKRFDLSLCFNFVRCLQTIRSKWIEREGRRHAGITAQQGTVITWQFEIILQSWLSRQLTFKKHLTLIKDKEEIWNLMFLTFITEWRDAWREICYFFVSSDFFSTSTHLTVFSIEPCESSIPQEHHEFSWSAPSDTRSLDPPRPPVSACCSLRSPWRRGLCGSTWRTEDGRQTGGQHRLQGSLSGPNFWESPLWRVRLFCGG